MNYDPKLKLRRRITKTCFAIIVLTIIGCAFFVVFGDGETRENLKVSSGIIISVLTFCTAIIAGFMGSVHHSDHKDKEHDRRPGE